MHISLRRLAPGFGYLVVELPPLLTLQEERRRAQQEVVQLHSELRASHAAVRALEKQARALPPPCCAVSSALVLRATPVCHGGSFYVYAFTCTRSF